MIKGWIYIITNPSMPGISKIGFSSKDPELRAKELNSTGIPTSYLVQYCALVDNPREKEQKIHKALNVYRVEKEWFKLSPASIVEEIRKMYETDLILEDIRNIQHEELKTSGDLYKQREAERLRHQKEAQTRTLIKIDENKKREHQRAIDKVKLENAPHVQKLREKIREEKDYLKDLPKIRKRLIYFRYSWFIGLGLVGLVTGGLVGLTINITIVAFCRMLVGGASTEAEVKIRIENLEKELSKFHYI